MSGVTVKSWLGDDCRRFVLTPSTTTFAALHNLIKDMYKLPDNDFVIKYKDVDGDLVTLTTDAEITEMVRSLELIESVAARTIRLEVFPKLPDRYFTPPQPYYNPLQHQHQHQHQHPQSLPQYSQHPQQPPSYLGPEDQLGGKHLSYYRARFADDYKDQEIYDVLRDISAYIAARDAEKVWAPSERSLISPSVMNKVAAAQPVSEGRLVSKSAYPNISAITSTYGDNVLSWNVEQVGKWLKAAGFPEWEKVFKENDVTGDVLVELTNDTLKDMGVISTGKRVKLLKLIEDLKMKKLAAPSKAPAGAARHKSLADSQTNLSQKAGRA